MSSLIPGETTLKKAGLITIVVISLSLQACAHVKPLAPGEAVTENDRKDAIMRAAVWAPTNIRRVDFKAGPRGPGSFTQNQWVNCQYDAKKELTGRSPKFACETSPGQEVKVKYGSQNAEVFGEVLSTRLFWGLGFPADRMYPVRVRCKGCPKDPKSGPEMEGDGSVFDPAAIERKLPGRAIETEPDSGWSFSELEDIGPEAGKAARAHRDGLKLLAAFIQHTDSKASNQRLQCPQGQEVGKNGCRKPILMVSDLGLTFGHAGLLIRNKNSVSLETWEDVPVWKDDAQCVAQLSGSLTGSLSNPKISEAGRAFLAGLLVQLSDKQLHDLFESARVKRRSSDPSSDPDKEGPPAQVADWVKAFKLKRAHPLLFIRE